MPGAELVRGNAAPLTTAAMLVHRLTHMLSCKEVSRLLSQGEDRRLTLVERVKLRLHLSVCDACTRFVRQLAFVRRALARYKG